MLSLRNSCRLFQKSPLSACLLQNSERTLRLYEPEVPNQVEVPDKFRLPIIQKMPPEWMNFAGKPPRGTREMYRILGEERIHNELILGQYGLVAVYGGYMKQVNFEVLRRYIGQKLIRGKSFAFYRVDAPFKPVTSHGAGKKLGGGKGGVKYYATPVRAGRVILEVGGNIHWEEVRMWLNQACKKLPFECVAVNKDMLDRLNKEEKRLQEANENPYTFEWMVRNNMFDCQSHLSPYDQKWFGKFIYRDRTLNKKWNLVRKSPYKGREGKAGH